MIDAKIIGFYDDWTSSSGGGVPFLMGNIGDEIQAVFQIDVHWESLCDYTITGGTTITRNDGGSFIADGFRLNDTFETIGAGANDGTSFTIASITDNVITAAGLTNGTYTTAELHGTTQIKSIDYFYNIAPSNNSFISLTDAGNVQKYNVDNLDATDTSTQKILIPVGTSKAWVVSNGISYIIGNGYSNFVQSFILVHETMITPLSLVNQANNFATITAPDYFKGDACLTWAGSFTAKTYKTDPCSPHTSGNIFCNGNTGWYNENFNGYSSDYSVDRIAYTNNTNNAISSCAATDIEIIIKSISGKFISPLAVQLFFHWFAEPESAYQNNNIPLLSNYHYDVVRLPDGAAPTNGDYYGTNYQAITNATLIISDPNTAQINFTSAFTTTFFQPGFKYVIGVIVQDPAITTTADSDRVTLLADYNTMFCDLTDPDYSKMMQDMVFFQHPKSASAGKTDINGIVGDIWLAKGYLGIANSSQVVLNSLDIAVEAVNSYTGERFDLERKSYNMRQFISDGNYVQAIDIYESRNWLTWSEYDYIRIKRCPAMDDATYAVYEISYPVRLMDETYRKLAAGGAYFQNPTNNWSQYSQNGYWDVKFTIYTEVEQAQVQRNAYVNDVTIRDYNVKGVDNTFDFNITSIDTIKAGTGIDTKGVISSTGITLIKVNVAGNFTSFPTGFDGFYGILGMCSVQTGSCDYASTNLKTDANSVWLGIDPINDPYVRLTITGNTTAVIETLIDGSKLDKSVDPSTWYITAKIGYQVTEQLLAQENQAFILQENGFGILIN
jgi:hypothetical protein